MATDYEIQELYVAYYSRPADPAGLAFWKTQMDTNPNFYADIAQAFSTSAEYQATYSGMSNREVVAEIYRNLFSREGDAAGIDFWTNALNNGAMTWGNAVIGISDGRQGSDAVVYNAKVSVAEAFTKRIDTDAEKTAYSGMAANQVAIDYIAKVDSFQDGATYIDPGQIDIAIAQIVGTPRGEGIHDPAVI